MKKVLKGLIAMMLSVSLLGCSKESSKTLEGTWYVADYLCYGSGQLVGNHFLQIVFDQDEISYIEDGNKQPLVTYDDTTVTYKVDGNTLKIDENFIPNNVLFEYSTYTITYHTDDSVTLETEDQSDGMILVKSDQIINDITELSGKWDITYSSGTSSKDMDIQFNDNQVVITEDGEESSSMCLYVDDMLEMPEVSMKVLVYQLSEDKIIMIEEEGDVLVLER